MKNTTIFGDPFVPNILACCLIEEDTEEEERSIGLPHKKDTMAGTMEMSEEPVVGRVCGGNRLGKKARQ